MKIERISQFFSTLMFMVLFVAPVAQSIANSDTIIVLQEIEDSTDAEEGEGPNFKDGDAELYYRSSNYRSDNVAFLQWQIAAWEYSIRKTTQRCGVDPPPPEFV